MRRILLIPCLIFFVFSQSHAGSNPYILGSWKINCGDTFTADNGSAPDAIKWTETDGANCMSIQSNELYYTYTGNGNVSSSVLSNWHFKPNQNWEIQLDIHVTDWPTPDTGTIFGPQLQVRNSDGSVYSHIVRYISGAADQYFAQGSTTGWDGSVPSGAGAVNGKIKFKMVDNVLYGTVWDSVGEHWEWDGVENAWVTFSEDFSGGNIYIRIRYDHPATTGSDTVTGESDNFIINYGKCYY